MIPEIYHPACPECGQHIFNLGMSSPELKKCDLLICCNRDCGAKSPIPEPERMRVTFAGAPYWVHPPTKPASALSPGDSARLAVTLEIPENVLWEGK